MNNELIERVRLAARRSIELAGRSSVINHLADYVTDAVLAELAGELEDAERWRYWLRKHGWSGYFDDGLTNSESAADIITAIDKARES